ncbi:MAG: modification methylase [Gammaproteobacteria bacterium]|nr:modification methylase [Gammaproteobacteria bacterium]
MKSTAGNLDLHAARAAKNDEFYTQRADIEAELFYYRKYFAGKTVYCNCDDPTASHFYAYFRDNFKFLKLRKVIVATYRNPDPNAHRGQTDLIAEAEEKYAVKQAEKKNKESPPIKRKQAVCVEYTGNKTGRPRTMRGDGWYHGGDFRSKESIALLKQADIVCTNPPFSLFREYVAQLFEYKKEFLILGSLNAISYKEIFPLLKTNQMWLGMNNGAKKFAAPAHAEKYHSVEDGTKFMHMGNVFWFTNLDHDKRHADLRKRLYRKHDPEKYPKYDNYDAVEVSKVADIPLDYPGVMGVPITFMDKYNPEQFEVLGCAGKEGFGLNSHKFYDEFVEVRQNGKLTGSSGKKTNGNAVMKGKPTKGNYFQKGDEFVHSLYGRIFIRHKHPRD